MTVTEMVPETLAYSERLTAREGSTGFGRRKSFKS